MNRKTSMKSYFTFTKNMLQRQFAYKANTIMFILGDAMMIAVTHYLWKAIYRSSSNSTLNGFYYEDMIIYVLLSFLTQLVISTEVSNTVSREVRNGSIASNLIKPISYEKRMFFEGLGSAIYGFVLIFIWGFIGILILSIKYGKYPGILNIILYFISLVLSYIINFYYNYSMGLLTFKVINMWGVCQIMEAVTALFSGMLIPLVFFPQLIQKIFDFFPFKSIIFTPCMIFLGKLNGTELYLALVKQVVWVVIMIVIGKKMYKALIKNLTILGG